MNALVNTYYQNDTHSSPKSFISDPISIRKYRWLLKKWWEFHMVPYSLHIFAVFWINSFTHQVCGGGDLEASFPLLWILSPRPPTQVPQSTEHLAHVIQHRGLHWSTGIPLSCDPSSPTPALTTLVSDSKSQHNPGLRRVTCYLALNSCSWPLQSTPVVEKNEQEARLRQNTKTGAF